MEGIYQYRDLKTNEVVYIGKDSNIHKNLRHYQHINKHYYHQQVINRVLQNNIDRYQYEIIYAGNYDRDQLNALEINSIAEEQPRFNFTKGGEGSFGSFGWHHSEESKQKMSDVRKGKTPWNKGKKGFKHSEETKKRISEHMKGKQNCLNNKLTTEHKMNISKGNNTSGYFRVAKCKKKEVKQGFVWAYTYYDENNVRRVISSIDIDKLEERILAEGLEWRKF